MFKKSEMYNARSIILSDKQCTFNSSVWYSKIFVFSFIDVLLNFLKDLRSVLFPRNVISAFMYFVL